MCNLYDEMNIILLPLNFQFYKKKISFMGSPHWRHSFINMMSMVYIFHGQNALKNKKERKQIFKEIFFLMMVLLSVSIHL